jgi:hypothetical protein
MLLINVERIAAASYGPQSEKSQNAESVKAGKANA